MNTRLTAAVAALGVAAAVVLAACSPTPSPVATDGPVATSQLVMPQAPVLAPLTELDLLADPGAYVGPSTATLAWPGVVPLANPGEPALPATVTSYDKAGERQVEVTDVSRIVAVDIAGSIAITLSGLGMVDHLVGRDSSTELPGTEGLPVVTQGGHAINPEAVLALKPTLVISDGSVGPLDSFQQLRDAGITVVFVGDLTGFDGAQEMARQVGAAVGLADAGERLAQRIGDEVAQVRAQIEAIAPPEGERLRMVFLYLRGSAGVYYVFGSSSGAGDLIRALGGVDAAADAGIGDMAPLTDEAMLAVNPDLILVMTRGLESVGGVEALIADRPAIALTQAGVNRRVVDMEDREILAFGPRSAAVLDALARAIYAPESP